MPAGRLNPAPFGSWETMVRSATLERSGAGKIRLLLTINRVLYRRVEPATPKTVLLDGLKERMTVALERGGEV